VQAGDKPGVSPAYPRLPSLALHRLYTLRMMIPAGYAAKRPIARPLDWEPMASLTHITEICSVSNCMAVNTPPGWFWDGNDDNKFWMANSPDVIVNIARAEEADLRGTRLYYYEAHDLEYDDTESPPQWLPYLSASGPGPVVRPDVMTLVGYDVVAYSVGSAPGCSPLSCNAIAAEVVTNAQCLYATFEEAMSALENGIFLNSEPGPFRIFAVYLCAPDWLTKFDLAQSSHDVPYSSALDALNDMRR
jgi:hypothetical protein